MLANYHAFLMLALPIKCVFASVFVYFFFQKNSSAVQCLSMITFVGCLATLISLVIHPYFHLIL